MPPDSLHRVKQGTTLPLNIQVGPPVNNLPLPVNGSKEAFSSSKLSLNSSCWVLEILLTGTVTSIPVYMSTQQLTPLKITQHIRGLPESVVKPINVKRLSLLDVLDWGI